MDSTRQAALLFGFNAAIPCKRTGFAENKLLFSTYLFFMLLGMLLAKLELGEERLGDFLQDVPHQLSLLG